MKFENLNENNVIITGNVESNTVSIDTDNLDFVITILSTNLYSNPIESLIRELVSNAWDSHVEANIDEPVILELSKSADNKYFCRIQDFGVGLSKERFDKIYRNIGSSTKRSDNSQIGGFGIGRFAALSYSNSVYITSNFEGIQYKYLMYKDGNKISIDLIHESETNERNGVEVLIYIKDYSDKITFANAIKKQLTYFENLYILSNCENEFNYITDFNKYLIKKYNHFYVNSVNQNKVDIILGKVRYPLRTDSLKSSYTSFDVNLPISLKFDIGDLEVTPNREEILYSKKNIEKIEEVFDNALSEIHEIIEDQKHKNFDNINDYIFAIQNIGKIILLQEKIDGETIIHNSFNISKDKLKYTLNSKFYDPINFNDCLKSIRSQRIIPITYTVNNSRISYTPKSISLTELKFYDNVYIGDVRNFNTWTKKYIRNKIYVYDEILFVYFTKSYYHYLRTIYSEIIEDYKYSKKPFDKEIFKVLIKYYIDIFNDFVIKFDNNSVPKDWIELEKKLQTSSRKRNTIDWKQNINLYVLHRSNIHERYVSVPEVYPLDTLSTKFKKLLIYSNRDDSEKLKLLALLINKLKSSDKCIFAEVAPTKLKLLSEIKNTVYIDDFMNVKYKIIRQIGTANLIFKEAPYIIDLAKIDNFYLISRKLNKVIKDLSDYIISYRYDDDSNVKHLQEDITQLCLDKGYLDNEMYALFKQYEKQLLNARVALLVSEEKQHIFGRGRMKEIPADRINLLIDYIVARKLFHPNLDSYLMLKKETIFNKTENETKS